MLVTAPLKTCVCTDQVGWDVVDSGVRLRVRQGLATSASSRSLLTEFFFERMAEG